jgi:hypothetical protein
MSDFVVIAHDGFARISITRRVHKTADKCRWCGSNTQGRLFQYGIERDDRPGRPDWDDRLFCSKSCRDCFHS